MLGALCHDFGKPATTQFFDGRWRSHAHDEAGVEPTVSFLDKLGIYTLDGYDVREQIIQLVRYHLKPGMFYKSQPGRRRVSPFSAKSRAGFACIAWRAPTAWAEIPNGCRRKNGLTRKRRNGLSNRVRELKVEKEAPKPILMGRHLIDLGLKPSPRFKKILDAVYEKQLDGASDSPKSRRRGLMNSCSSRANGIRFFRSARF
jgi:tRNA nucleotidyltransferase (CCA-adding enzyme)